MKRERKHTAGSYPNSVETFPGGCICILRAGDGLQENIMATFKLSTSEVRNMKINSLCDRGNNPNLEAIRRLTINGVKEHIGAEDLGPCPANTHMSSPIALNGTTDIFKVTHLFECFLD